ncbi:MAG: hypothetical protein KI791_05170 [Cyclobacteriaceae bacterium]|nr:hypothetical protein [Cyclobacteriaceae bacterium SS2]
MKTKLTLTVNKSIIEKAKKVAKERSVSVSRLFEEVFEDDSPQPLRNERQKAASELLKTLGNQAKTQTAEKSDKELIKNYVNKKYS